MQGQAERELAPLVHATDDRDVFTMQFEDFLDDGKALTEFHGVLTGVPEYVGPGGPLMNDARS